jgi:hypothetical protein
MAHKSPAVLPDPPLGEGRIQCFGQQSVNCGKYTNVGSETRHNKSTMGQEVCPT